MTVTVWNKNRADSPTHKIVHTLDNQNAQSCMLEMTHDSLWTLQQVNKDFLLIQFHLGKPNSLGSTGFS